MSCLLVQPRELKNDMVCGSLNEKKYIVIDRGRE